MAAFDFDHTIVDDNSDIVARDLISKFHPSFTIPDDVKELYSSQNGWTQYMAEIFKILHELKIPQNEIVAAITAIPEVTGVGELIRNLVDMNFEVIIISDSNMEFIQCWCEANGISKLIDKVYSNPASFNEDGLLTIQPFHKQTTCSMSQMNLCKGQVLEEHIARKATNEIDFDKVFYIGDGGNDYCPITRLRTDDYGCARVGFKLAKMLAARTNVKAETVLWENGNELLEQIKGKI